MSAPKHTPGPWNLGNPGLRGSDAHMCEVMTAYATKNEGATIGCYDVICRTWSPNYTASSVRLTREECFANARLIAAAPETAAERDRLREVNAELVAALEQIAHRAHKHAVCTQVQYSLGDIARAAIAKATGGEA
jgi:hypothetical protein